MKIGIISLGCAKNTYDTDIMLGLFINNGIEIVSDLYEADIILVNTCGFIEDAKREAIDNILDVISIKNETSCKIIVTGCMVTRYLKELKQELSEVDLFIPLDDYSAFSNLFEVNFNFSITNKNFDYNNRFIDTYKNYSYLKIADGCNHTCAYCAIPLIKGKQVCKNYSDILLEAKKIEESGINELILIAQDTTSYYNNGYNLSSLLKELSLSTKFNYIRFLYGYPKEITIELLETIKKYNICSYFDIPIQHSSDNVLDLMKRNHNKQDLIELITNIRNYFPISTLRTTVIVGFPGETESDFEDLVNFISEYKFDKLGVFKYSSEENTASYDYTNKVDSFVIDERFNKIVSVQANISRQLNKKW
ncbi:MAG: 30S ribosomal protein S12 methylthiotransferase RimO, partial [Acholeplasmatales bacterium]|nr:30S ribosomal protein S12 methylthiotransferase RimO [Acholeplasmatales bacterium]